MKNYLSLIKFSHTIFALPFALIGFFFAINHINNGIDFRKLLLVIGCMITARSAAMAFNRYIDRDIDKSNIRTAVREIPSGVIKAENVLFFVIINSLLFVIFTYFINKLCFYLSPIALIVILGYSLTKRFTFLCHIILGIGLALAPIGAYLAVTSKFNLIPILIGISVLFWVAGFDIIYALQDEEFDAKAGLNSIPAAFGKKNALLISRILHFISACFLLYSMYEAKETLPLNILTAIALIFFICMLIYQHSIVKVNDLSKVNLAFFTTNGVASFVFGCLIITDLYL
jgi:4-hydroxybenzoate polyprenyltransferase